MSVFEPSAGGDSFNWGPDSMLHVQVQHDWREESLLQRAQMKLPTARRLQELQHIQRLHHAPHTPTHELEYHHHRTQSGVSPGAAGEGPCMPSNRNTVMVTEVVTEGGAGSRESLLDTWQESPVLPPPSMRRGEGGSGGGAGAKSAQEHPLSGKA